ncbi:MAG: helix-turn-helix domain-containing protein [Burkholderiales bacterium]
MGRKAIQRIGTVGGVSPLTTADPRLREIDAATYLGVSMRTLQNWRYERRRGREIPFIQLGGRYGPVFYRQSALDAYVKQFERGPTNEAA